MFSSARLFVNAQILPKGGSGFSGGGLLDTITRASTGGRFSGPTVTEIAEDGETMSWKGKQSVAISAGDAGAVSITQNGKKLGSMGGAGEVVEKTYSKNEPTKRNE